MHVFLRAAAPILPILLAAGLGACNTPPGSRPFHPAISDQAYNGPAITIASNTGPRHLIILTAPSPGWTFTFDQLGPPGDQVYITIRRPDPRLLYPQVIVEQKMDSTVPIANPTQVYARVLDFDEKAGPQTYRLARETGR